MHASPYKRCGNLCNSRRREASHLRKSCLRQLSLILCMATSLSCKIISHVNFTTLIMSPSPGSRILPTKIPQVMGKCLRPCVELGGTNHGGPSPLATVRYKALIMIQLRIDRIFACVEWPANSAVSAGLAGERQNFLHLFMAVCKEAHCCMLTKKKHPQVALRFWQLGQTTFVLRHMPAWSPLLK